MQLLFETFRLYFFKIARYQVRTENPNPSQNRHKTGHEKIKTVSYSIPLQTYCPA